MRWQSCIKVFNDDLLVKRDGSLLSLRTRLDFNDFYGGYNTRFGRLAAPPGEATTPAIAMAS